MTHSDKLSCSQIPLSLQSLILQALSVAASILRSGTKSLLKASSHGEREFHKALSNLRQRWRLRRTPHGSIVGDLSYLSGWKNSTLFYSLLKGSD